MLQVPLEIAFHHVDSTEWAEEQIRRRAANTVGAVLKRVEEVQQVHANDFEGSTHIGSRKWSWVGSYKIDRTSQRVDITRCVRILTGIGGGRGVGTAGARLVRRALVREAGRACGYLRVFRHGGGSWLRVYSACSRSVSS